MGKQDAVDKHYKKVALSGKLYSSLTDEENAKKIADISRSFGYDPEDVDGEANMGLGCGNPFENANVKEGETIIDLGCGKGMDTFIAAKAVGEEGLAIGVDRLDEMIEKAKYISDKRGFTNTTFVQSDITDLKLEDNTADIMISNCVINLIEDKKKVCQEIIRVLKPGGRISFSDVVQYHPLPGDIKNDDRLHATCVAGSVSVEKVYEILEEVGFEDITIIQEDITDEYANKWGHDLDLKHYLKRAKILAVKAQ